MLRAVIHEAWEGSLQGRRPDVNRRLRLRLVFQNCMSVHAQTVVYSADLPPPSSPIRATFRPNVVEIVIYKFEFESTNLNLNFDVFLSGCQILNDSRGFHSKWQTLDDFKFFSFMFVIFLSVSPVFSSFFSASFFCLFLNCFSLLFVFFFFFFFLLFFLSFSFSFSCSLSLFFSFPFPFSLYLSFSLFGWCCLVSSFFGWCCVSPIFLRGVAWFHLSVGGVACFSLSCSVLLLFLLGGVVAFSFSCWVVLPSIPSFG